MKNTETAGPNMSLSVPAAPVSVFLMQAPNGSKKSGTACLAVPVQIRPAFWVQLSTIITRFMNEGKEEEH